MVFKQQGMSLIENKATIVYSPEENEIILSSAGFIRIVECKVFFISETRSCPLNVPDSSREVNSSFDAIPSCTISDNLPIQIAVDDINRTTSEQDAIIFRDDHKLDNLTLQEIDFCFLQILESLQNKNDCISAATAPPAFVTSAAGIIDTSCNEIIAEDRVDSNETSSLRVSDRSNSVPVGRVGDDGRLKGYFCSDVVFNLNHRVLSEL